MCKRKSIGDQYFERTCPQIKQGLNKSRSALTYLRECGGKQRKGIILLSILRTTVSFSLVLVSLCMRNLIDSAIGGDKDSFIRSAGLLLVLYLVQQGAKALAILCAESCRSGLENALKNRLSASILNKSYASVSGRHSEEWMSLLTSDTAIVANSIVSVVPEAAAIAVRLIGITVVMCGIIPELMVILIPAGVSMMLISFVLRRRMKQQSKEIQKADQDFRVVLSEKLRSLMVIHAFSREEDSLSEAENSMEAHRGKRMDKASYSAKMNLLFGIVLRGASFIGALIGGYRLLDGTLSYGSFYAVIQLISLVRAPASEISGLIPDFYSMLASTERLMEIESYPDEKNSSVRSEEELFKWYKNDFESVEIDHVSFSYDTPAEEDVSPSVLKDISMTINKGEFLGISGTSGIGKTTLMKLLLCLYHPDSGHIRLRAADSTDTMELDASFRGLFAYVPQGHDLISGTVRSAVTFGEKDADENMIWDALDTACLRDDVMSLSDGLDTAVAEGANNFSEGQKQRLAIARTLYSRRPILLLDEVTSSLDEKTEEDILYNLREMPDKTVLIITHRESVLNKCDRVISISDDGTIVERT